MSTISRTRLLGSVCALGLAGPLLAATAATAAPAADKADLAALGESLALELAAIATYATAAASAVVTAPVAAVLERFAADHTVHRDIILGELRAAGATPSDVPTSIGDPAMTTEADVLAVALALERRLAQAHLAPVGTFRNRGYAASSASIVGVETAHVALLSEALRKGPAYPAGIVGA